MGDIWEFAPLWGVWEIESLIGQGSYGKVYKAKREEFGKVFYSAIKHVSIPSNESEKEDIFIEGYATDVRTAQNYYKQVVGNLIDEINFYYTFKGHTNIVSYEDHKIIEKKDGVGYDLFIRMELLRNLTTQMQEEQMPIEKTVKIGIDICTALELLWDKKIVHRDIKPSNIFVSSSGDYKLGDFGVARNLEYTTSGMSLKGTYSFMAPEVYKGQSANSTVDIYSLGLVLYKMANYYRAPFLNPFPEPVNYDDIAKSMEKRMMGEEMPSPLLADEELSELICKACAYEKESRWQTPTEFKNALVNYKNKKSVTPVQEEHTAEKKGEFTPDFIDKKEESNQEKVIIESVELNSHTRPTFKNRMKRNVIIGAAATACIVIACVTAVGINMQHRSALNNDVKVAETEEQATTAAIETTNNGESAVHIADNYNEADLEIVPEEKPVIEEKTVVLEEKAPEKVEKVKTTTASTNNTNSSAKTNSQPAQSVVTSLTISTSNVSLGVGETTQISAVAQFTAGNSGSISWYSSDYSVANVGSTGVITARGVGTAKITAVCGDKKATCTVDVR